MKKDLAKREKTMTVKEVSKILNVTPEAIKKHIRELYPNIIKNGVATLLTEEQVTKIKHRMLPTTSVVGSVTRLEMLQNIQRDLQWLTAFNAELQNENNLLKQDKANLQIELDQSKEYITIKRMEKLNPTEHFNWRLLKKESERLHKPTKETFDQNYGTVKAYHIDVWESLYFDSINYPA